MTDNLMDGLFKQMNRCRELIKAYDSIGTVGAFAKAIVQGAINQAESAIQSGDITEMVKAYQDLEACE